MTLLVPSTISINAETEEARALGRRYASRANAMLVGLQARQRDGVSIVGQTRTLADGTTIKVGFSDNGVSRMGWAQINVPTVPKAVEQKIEREEKRSDYIWIGLEVVSGGQYASPCPDDDPEDPPGFPILWVWEPPAENEPWGIISAWRSVMPQYSEPVIPDLLEPFVTGPGDFYALPSGAYLIHRYVHEPGIISPVTEEEDGDDLWHQVFVMDPGDGKRINTEAMFDKEPPDDEALAIHAFLAGEPTYLLPDDPGYEDSDNQPHEREEAHPAEVRYGAPYMAKVYFSNSGDACNEIEPIVCRLKIISGKRPMTVIDRYDFTIERPGWKLRSALPRGDGTSQYLGLGNEISPGENAMDSGWSAETWAIDPMLGSELTDVLPDGLNEGGLDDIHCSFASALGIAHVVGILSPDPNEDGPPWDTDGWGFPQTLWRDNRPKDRCGEDIFGEITTLYDNFPRSRTYHDIKTDASTSITGGLLTWEPGKSVGLEGGELDAKAAFFFFLPLTNEWLEADPAMTLQDAKAMLLARGYESLYEKDYLGLIETWR